MSEEKRTVSVASDAADLFLRVLPEADSVTVEEVVSNMKGFPRSFWLRLVLVVYKYTLIVSGSSLEELLRRLRFELEEAGFPESADKVRDAIEKMGE